MALPTCLNKNNLPADLMPSGLIELSMITCGDGCSHINILAKFTMLDKLRLVSFNV